jgi:multiple sugar transport system substrate-binding protein
VALSYSGYKGVQCSLPALADAYGIYMNTAMLKAAGFTSPPKTLSELTTMAKKLTVRNADGSLKRIGINPLFGHYETISDGLRQAYGAPWFDAKGQPVLSKDPRWAAMLKWQKALVDWYGYDKLRKFTAASADEFGASNDFEIGRVAMQYDGEWRTAFIKNEHPELKYTTAPFPAADGQAAQYGSGPIAGDIVAIPKGSKHPDEAWLLIKFLASDTDAIVGLSNRLRNLPTTKAANSSPKLDKDPHFAPFFKIFTNTKSEFNPLTPIGQQYGDTFQAFATKWQAGKVSDLTKGLQGLDKQISDELKQASAGNAP